MKRIKTFFQFRRKKRITTPKKRRPWWKYLLYFILIMFGLGVFAVLGVFAWIWKDLPNINKLEDLIASESSVILDREGNELYRIHGDENREPVDLEEMSPYIIDAVLAIEDDQFYEHPGFDFQAILKAICAEAGVCSGARGGSTLTQQFVKNAFLTNERTYKRKLLEVITAIRVENSYSKDEILEMYLNRISYVSNIHGVELASQAFYRKPAKDLTIAESAVLAALPKSPTYYSPYGSNRYSQIINITEEEIIENDIRTEQDLIDINDDQLIQFGLIGKSYTFGEGDQARNIYVKGRTDLVINRMEELGKITSEEAQAAIVELNNLEFQTLRQDIKAPHFVFHVIGEVEERYGTQELQTGGLTIRTTLDPEKQAYAEEAIAAQAETNLSRHNANNAALVSMDPDTGEILAMVGSVDYNNEEIDGQVNVATSKRSPGSSFKPIVYAAAFLKGYAPSTTVYDVKTSFSGWYEPQNSDGSFRGPVNFRKSLGASLNIPAIKAGYLAGIPNVLELARNMGLELPLSDSDYGLSLSLGAGEASPLSMAKSYSIFANGGYDVTPTSILKIEDRHGNILEEHKPEENRKNTNLILDPQVAYLITDILADRSARPDAFWREQLTINGHINAAKTGTSNGKKNGVNYPQDGWTIGYTRHLVTAVWAGNTDGTLMNGSAYGLTIAAPIWKDYMNQATADMPKTKFEAPEGIKYVQVSSTGNIPTQNTASTLNEVFASFSVITKKDVSYKTVKVDKVSGKLATEYTPAAAIEERSYFVHNTILPEGDSEYDHWQKAVRAWAIAAGEGGDVPTEYDDVHTAETMANPPKVSITSPAPNSTVAPPTILVQAAVSGDSYIRQVDYYLNGQKVGSATGAPYSLRISIPEASPGTSYTLKAVAVDDLYRSGQGSTAVTVGVDDTPPSLSFGYPSSGSSITANSSVSIKANASDANGAVKSVSASVNGQSLGSSDSAPYTFAWQPSEPGEYTIQLSASDYVGNTSTQSQTVTVKEPTAAAPSGSSAGVSAPGSAAANQSVPVTVSLPADDVEGAGTVELIVKSPGSVRGNTVASTGATGASTYTLVWGGGEPGTYEVYFKVGGQFTQRRTVVVE